MSLEDRPSATATRHLQCPPIAPFNALSERRTASRRSSPALHDDDATLILSPMAPPHWPHAPVLEGFKPSRHLPVAALALPDGPPREAHHRIPSITLSASEVQTYIECPWRHRHRYRTGFTTNTLDLGGERPLSAADRGSALHAYLALFDPEWSASERRERMRQLLAELRPGASVGDDVLDDSMQSAERVTTSRWHRRLWTASMYCREVPFLFAFSPDVALAGRMDALFQEGDRWVVLDYKSTCISNPPARLSDVMDEAIRYSAQAAIYAMAVRAVYGPVDVSVVFLFTETGDSAKLVPNDSWYGGWHERLNTVIDRIVHDMYDPQMTRVESRCSGCAFERVCEGIWSLERARRLPTRASEDRIP